MKLSSLISMCGAVAAMAVLPSAMAADWPSKPIRMVVPFPAGGSSDVVARQISQHLSTVLGQQFVVDNRAGAAGNIGTDAVAKAAPDGYTLGQSTSGPLANNKLLYHGMPFDAQKDLTPVALVGEIPLVIAVNPGAMRAKNLKELVVLAKNAPEPISVGHPGAGTIGHLAMESLKSVSGLNLQMVPYKGDTPAITDLLGGQIQVVGAPVTSFIPNIQAGKLRALAVTSKSRFPGLPNVPTALEQGVNLEAGVWFAVVGPAGLPKPIVARLNKEINRFTNSPEGRAQLAQFALVPANVSPEALGELMKSEPAKWKPIVESAKITLD